MMGNLPQVVQRKFLMFHMQYGNGGVGLPTGVSAGVARGSGFATPLRQITDEETALRVRPGGAFLPFDSQMLAITEIR